MGAPSEQLQAALSNRALIVVLGPQIDRESGLPSLDEVARACVAQARELEPEELEDVDDMIERGQLGEAFERAQFVLGRAQFRRAVVDQLSRDFRVPRLLDAVAQHRDQLRALYVTSLVDGLYNRALRGHWPVYDEARPQLAQRKGLVFHLRGTLTRPDGWILSATQAQRELSPSSARGELLATVYNAHRLLLLGFEAEGPALRDLLQTLPIIEGADAPEHFIALEDGCAPQTRRQLARRGFQVIERAAEPLLLELGGDSTRAELQEEAGELPDCPYPGLETFGEDLSKLFFGRHVEVSRATSRLGPSEGGPTRRWLFVEGASGVGKSSFVHAGLVPALRRGFASGAPSRWVVARMRPGHAPLSKLIEATLDALELSHGKRSLSPTQLTDRPEQLAELVADRTPAGHGFLLIVDQFEEAATIARESERAAFTACLGALLEAEPAYLITTVRSDFVPSVQARLPGFAEILNDRAERYVLPPISRVGLREVIVEPAARAGVVIEPELLEAMLADADPEGEVDEHGEVRSSTAALPLVAHMLRRMWESGAAEDRLMELAEYRALGGVRGGIRQSAEELVAALEPGQLACLEALFLGLARVERDGTVTRRPIARATAIELAGGGEAGETLLALLSGGGTHARMLTIREGLEGDEVDLVHEALLRDWDRCRQWFESNLDQLVRRQELAQRARFWLDAGQPSAGLPIGEELELLLSAEPSGDERELQERFVAALRQHDRTRKLGNAIRWLTILSLLALIAFLFAVKEATDAKDEVVTANKKVVTANERAADGVQKWFEATTEVAVAEVGNTQTEHEEQKQAWIAYRAKLQGQIDKLNVEKRELLDLINKPADPCKNVEGKSEAVLQFKSGEMVFSQSSATVYEQLCGIAKNDYNEDSKPHVFVYGFTDAAPSDLGNDLLSWARAVVAENQLVTLGVPKDRIQIIAGGVHPDIPNGKKRHNSSRVVEIEVLTRKALKARVRKAGKAASSSACGGQTPLAAKHACYEERASEAREKRRLEALNEEPPEIMRLSPNFAFPSADL